MQWWEWEWGSIWGSIGEKLGEFFFSFFRFLFFGNYWVFVVFYLLKMAYSCLRMVSNMIFNIFGDLQVSTKLGTLDPLCIAKIF